MARWHYDLTGAEPIIRDVPMSDSALIDNGEFIMQHATAARKQEFITGFVDSSACMVNGLGISLEQINTTGTVGGYPLLDAIDTQASINTATATGQRWGKAIINPFAVYLTEYSQAAADDEVASTNESADTTVTLTNIEDNIAGGWIYATHLSPVTSERGQLRYISAESSDDLTFLTAFTCTASSTTLIKIVPQNHELIDLTADGKSIATDLPASPVVTLKCVANYIKPNGGALEQLREKLHDSSATWDSFTKFYADIVLLDHAFNTVATG